MQLRIDRLSENFNLAGLPGSGYSRSAGKVPLQPAKSYPTPNLPNETMPQSKRKCYKFNSLLRISHEGQSPIFLQKSSA
jgi:hypothetical protein